MAQWERPAAETNGYKREIGEVRQAAGRWEHGLRKKQPQRRPRAGHHQQQRHDSPQQQVMTSSEQTERHQTRPRATTVPTISYSQAVQFLPSFLFCR